jgi:hypothetical protein
MAYELVPAYSPQTPEQTTLAATADTFAATGALVTNTAGKL